MDGAECPQISETHYDDQPLDNNFLQSFYTAILGLLLVDEKATYKPIKPVPILYFVNV